MAADKLGVCASSTAFLIASQTLAYTYNYSPLALFMMLFGETIAKLTGWCKNLEDQARGFIANHPEQTKGTLLSQKSRNMLE